jgi:hypothetical protein
LQRFAAIITTFAFRRRHKCKKAFLLQY